MSVIHAPEERRLDVRLLLVPGALLLVLGAYLTKLWFLQVVIAPDLQERAANTGETTVSRLAPRGKIVDRNGKIVAGVRPNVVVMAAPKVALAHPEAIKKVADILGISTDVLEKGVKDVRYAGDVPAPVYVGADVAAASIIAESSDELPGFSVETHAMRYYAGGEELSHILGYVRTPRDVDVKRLKEAGIVPAEFVGIQGLERKYEAELMGQPGLVKAAVDVRGRKTRDLHSVDPVPGSTLVLSIDDKLQAYALSLIKGRRGSIVMLDPKNGEVLCMVSSPSYDSSTFLNGISKDDYASLVNDPTKPLFFRAASAAYAPGSTFKIVTTIAAWLSGKFSTTATAYCDGYLKIGKSRFKCLGHHGAVSFDQAFTKSCNVYFGDLATKIGPDVIRDVCERIGFGHTTGLDLPTESAGVVPTEAWWAKHRKRPFSMGDTVNFSVGQGELAVTPLQMANLVALVANEGVSYKPHFLKAVVGPEEGAKPQYKKPQILGQIDAPHEKWEILKRAMLHVIQQGTARHAQIAGLEWGGKTGSAENRKDHETHSWFVGIAPLEKSKVVICVMVENAGHGGEIAAPIAANVVKYWLQGKSSPAPQIEVQSSLSPEDNDSTSASPVWLPDSP